MKKYGRLLLILILSLVTIYGLLRLGNIDFSLDILTRIDWRLLAPMFIVFYAGMFARGLRWQHILKGMGRPVNYVYLQALLFAGFFVSSILPARAGDIGRVAMLKRDHNIPFSQSIASIAAERALDVFAVLSLGVIGAMWALQGKIPAEILQLMGGTAVLLALGLIGLFAIPGLERWLRYPFPFGLHRWARKKQDQKIYQTSWRFYQKGLDFGFSMIYAVRGLGKNPIIMALVLAESFFIWFGDTLIVYLALTSVGVIAPFNVSLVGNTVGVLATIAPITPSALGQFEAGVIGTLALFDIPLAQSTLAVLLVRFVSLWTFIPVTGLITYGFGFSRVLNLSNANTDSGPVTPLSASTIPSSTSAES